MSILRVPTLLPRLSTYQSTKHHLTQIAMTRMVEWASSVKTLFLYAGILALPLAEAFPKLTPAFNLAVCSSSASLTRTPACICLRAYVRFLMAAC